jgi:hypothetical protein
VTDLIHQDWLDFLARGLVAAEKLDPKTRAVWQTEFRRELSRRGGLVGPRHVIKKIGNELLRDLTHRGIRIMRDELVKRLPEMTDDEAEKLDADFSDTLASALNRIKD